jgi:murein L,D-transpeptidase YafK
MGKILIGLLLMLTLPTFKETQLNYPRVRSAYEEKEGVVKSYFARKEISYKNFQLFLRAFKKERLLEVWVKESTSDHYVLLSTYDFCATSGDLGPKRKEGDLQIPEGVYTINHFNPQSNFHLSLGINYPNASDKLLGDQVHPGGEIYLHGNCVTIGCIPLTDDKIKELYVLAVEARNNGQEKIPVHIFPAKITTGQLNALKQDYPASTVAFWENLKVVYDDFELSKKLKSVKIKNNGQYTF